MVTYLGSLHILKKEYEFATHVGLTTPVHSSPRERRCVGITYAGALIKIIRIIYRALLLFASFVSMAMMHSLGDIRASRLVEFENI